MMETPNFEHTNRNTRTRKGSRSRPLRTGRRSLKSTSAPPAQTRVRVNGRQRSNNQRIKQTNYVFATDLALYGANNGPNHHLGGFEPLEPHASGCFVRLESFASVFCCCAWLNFACAWIRSFSVHPLRRCVPQEGHRTRSTARSATRLRTPGPASCLQVGEGSDRRCKYPRRHPCSPGPRA